MKFIHSIIDPFRPKLKPKIIIIGAQKSGTSALFEMLARHPKIIPPNRKEITFFNDEDFYCKGIEAYWKTFPIRPLRGGGWNTLDATPGYLSHPQAAKRLYKHIPKASLLVLLRDPVRRAYSDHNMFSQFKGNSRYNHLFDSRTFEEAMNQELAAADQKDAPYLTRGHYADQLANYFDYFDKEQILIFDHGHFKQNPEVVLKAICVKNDLSTDWVNAEVRAVRNNVRNYKSVLSEEMESRLREYYEPHNENLAELLGYRLDLSE